MGMTVNQTELAGILGVTDVTIWEWQKLEKPVPMTRKGERGLPNEYDLAAAVQWYVEREVAKRAPKVIRDELAAVDLELKQMDLAERKGGLVPAADVKPLWEGRVLVAAAYMAGRHSRLAGLLEATPGIEAKRELLKKEDADFLNKLGVDGDRMQAEMDTLLARLAGDEAASFLRRIAGNDDEHQTTSDSARDLGAAGAA